MIDGLISFPPIARLGSQALQIPVSFVVDTGADATLILPVHYDPYVYSDFRNYPIDRPGGYGGSIEVRRVAGDLYLPEESSQYLRLSLELEVAKPSDELEDFPSVLGRDILQRYRLVIDKSVNLVVLDHLMGPGP